MEEQTIIKVLVEKFGGSLWEKYGKRRVYINNIAAIYGIETARYNTGNISSAMLNGVKISNSEAKRTLSKMPDKFWYDLEDGKFHWKTWEGDDVQAREIAEDVIGKIEIAFEEEQQSEEATEEQLDREEWAQAYAEACVKCDDVMGQAELQYFPEDGSFGWSSSLVAVEAIVLDGECRWEYHTQLDDQPSVEELTEYFLGNDDLWSLHQQLIEDEIAEAESLLREYQLA